MKTMIEQFNFEFLWVSVAFLTKVDILLFSFLGGWLRWYMLIV